MKRIYAIGLHLLFWGYRFGFGIVTLPWRKPGSSVYLSDFFGLFDISSYILAFSTFYINYLLIMPRLFNKKKNIALAIAWFGMFVWYIGLRYFMEEYLFFKWFGSHNYVEGTRIGYYIADNIYFAGSIIVPSIVLWIIIHWMKVEQQQLKLQEAAGTAEVNFLKSQVNPHFLYNTLNNIYSLVYHQSEKALPAIMRLSELMRYMTRESSVDKIQLDKEIKYIESFLELESLRVVGDANVSLQVNGQTAQAMIAPLLLIPFVENGFKHGVVTDKENPFVINLTVDDLQVLHLHTANKINSSQKDSAGGVGMQNVKRRLELLYPGRYKLETGKQGDHYICDLTINL